MKMWGSRSVWAVQGDLVSFLPQMQLVDISGDISVLG